MVMETKVLRINLMREENRAWRFGGEKFTLSSFYDMLVHIHQITYPMPRSRSVSKFDTAHLRQHDYTSSATLYWPLSHSIPDKFSNKISPATTPHYATFAEVK
jgi:hypothetical protein